MNILLTNDDGIRAPGISAMYEALVDREGRLGGPLGRDVFTIAPLTVQSATSHGVTFHVPLMVERQSVELTGEGRMEGLSVDGRPADCVKLAICNLWPERYGDGSVPDLVISGMNDGANCGINVLYSGTVAAAIEAAFLGVPSIAVSMQRGKGRSRFDVGAHWARRVIDMLLAEGLPNPHECLSINIPLCEEDGSTEIQAMPPVKVCPMNVHGLVDKYEKRVSPLGATYYWAAGHGLDFKGTDEGSDVQELLRGCITVTPLRYDMTAHDGMAKWSRRV
ncbi:MAG: 5'/3'-nucleotidase SurE [Phycisphaerales bacterium]